MRQTIAIYTSLAMATLVAGCRSSDAPEVERRTAALGGEAEANGVPVYRACRNDSFFIDVPLTRHTLAAAWAELNWLNPLASAMQQQAESIPEQRWFEQPCQNDESLDVSVVPVLAERLNTGSMMRNDGHARFHRLRFQCVLGEGSEPVRRTLSVTPKYLCDVVETLRIQVAAVTGVSTASNDFFVGRECEASAVAGYEANPTLQMQTWHYPALGHAPANNPIPSAPVAQLVHLDSGVEPTVASALSADTAHDFVSEEMTPGLHGHGTGMAVFARQVAPNARLQSPRVIDGAGLSTSESMSRGLDAALFDLTEAGRPLVINMSLGWPAPLARRAGIAGVHSDGSACLSYEDPFGESVRYLLYVARELESTRRVFVVAAAGNQTGNLNAPIHQAGSTDPFPSAGAVLAPSTMPTALDTQLCFNDGIGRMFPGAYDDVTSCGPDFLETAFAVSAIDANFEPAVNAIEGSETALVAVGQHIVAAGPNGPVNPPSPFCPAQLDSQASLPRVYTGSSVSTDFVSAAAVRAQRQLSYNSNGPMRAYPLARLLYLTAEPLCRFTREGIPVRRLSIQNLDRAIEQCPDLVACAGNVGGTPINGHTLADCQLEVEACGITVGPTSPPPPLTPMLATCPEPSSSPPIPTSHPLRCAVPMRQGSLNPSECGTNGIPCTLDDAYDRPSIASAGPQPMGDGCPYCIAQFGLQLSSANLFAPQTLLQADVVFELSPHLPIGTQLTSPQLVVTYSNSSGSSHIDVLDLVDNGLFNPSDWVPGNTIPLTLSIPTQVPFSPDTIGAELHMKINQDGKETVVDRSALVVQNNIQVLH